MAMTIMLTLAGLISLIKESFCPDALFFGPVDADAGPVEFFHDFCMTASRVLITFIVIGVSYGFDILYNEPTEKCGWTSLALALVRLITYKVEVDRQEEFSNLKSNYMIELIYLSILILFLLFCFVCNLKVLKAVEWNIWRQLRRVDANIPTVSLLQD